MNKYKKLAFAAVSVVMAGSMAISFAACGGGNDDKKSGPNISGNGAGDITNGNYLGYTNSQDTWLGGGMNASGTVDGNFNRGTEPAAANLSAGKPSTDASGNLTYASSTTLKTSFGYSKVATGITFDTIKSLAGGSESAQSVTFAGKTYSSGNLKPAWQALNDQLDINISDDWVAQGGQQASDNIAKIKENSSLANYAMLTASADTIVTESANNTLLDVNQYLYYMPNYAAFLQANPIVRLSLTANADTGAMYMLPYFDGNDDIEKYVLMRKDIVEKLLDGADYSAATGTFAAQGTAKNGAETKGAITVDATSSHVKAYMGQTGGYRIAVTDPSALRQATADEVSYGNNLSHVNKADAGKTVTVVVDYNAALTAAQDEATALGAAIKEVTDTVYNVNSGNIVDIQNYVIDAKNGNVTGAQLIKILREYIKVAYHKDGETAAFYTQLSDVFNSAYAAWDVDLYVALGRCAVSSSALLGDATKGEAFSYMLGSRQGTTDRSYDVASMAGELYGVRGLTSRFAGLYTYIDKDGNMKDARADAATWDALANMSALAKEGLYYTGQGAAKDVASIGKAGNTAKLQIYSSTDYVQTQTAKGGFAAQGVTNLDVEAGYNYAPILTPVSHWDTDDDGVKDTVMRFTESWRGVKDGGFTVSLAYVKDNPDRLAAVLKFIDYFFSNDGQILMTYGPQSTAGNITKAQGATVNTAYGTWYATKAAKTLEAAKTEGIVDTFDGEQYFVKGAANKANYFCYKNELYTGTFYNGRQIPTLTDENLDVFYNISGQNFTAHARNFLGSCLNLGIKDQGFEYQCTSDCGLVGADIFAIAINNGTIRHTRQVLDEDNLWYTLVPTKLPFVKIEIEAMDDDYKYVSGNGGDGFNFFFAKSSCRSNLLTDIMYYGYDTSVEISCVAALHLSIPGNGAGVVAMLNDKGMSTVDGFAQTRWEKLVAYYGTLTA